MYFVKFPLILIKLSENSIPLKFLSISSAAEVGSGKEQPVIIPLSEEQLNALHK